MTGAGPGCRSEVVIGEETSGETNTEPKNLARTFAESQVEEVRLPSSEVMVTGDGTVFLFDRTILKRSLG
jgi:hypothetical protein